MTASDNKIIEENNRRHSTLFPFYDPVTGEGSLEERFSFALTSKITWYLPISMKSLPGIQAVLKKGGLHKYSPGVKYLRKHNETLDQYRVRFLRDLIVLRREYDFEFWAATKAWIRHKENRKMVPFILASHQRYIIHELEKMRLAGKPIRLIVLKARQLGSSTVIDMYMLWIMSEIHTSWNLTIAAHVQSSAANIKRMFENSISYSKDFTIKNVGSSLIKQIVERDSIIRVGSMVKPDTLRGDDIQMVHYSEVGLWKKTAELDPEDLIASISSSVLSLPDTVIVMESTAKSKGSFFYNEWMDSVNGISANAHVFIAWWQVQWYSMPFSSDKEKLAFYHNLNQYGKFLWRLGATLEGIQWYFFTMKDKNYKPQKMHNEFPSTAEEAFTSIGERVFDIEYVNNISNTIRPPKFIGDISADSKKGKMAFQNIRFIENSSNGYLKVWDFPDTSTHMSNRYIVSVDIGGRTENANFSVIRVIDRYWRTEEGGVDEFIATWRGHLDVDLVVWKAAQLAKAYNNALLVVERNSIDSKHQHTDGDHTWTVFNEIAPHYKNLYADSDPQSIKEGLSPKYGFFTGSGSSKNSKTAIVDNLTALMREHGFIEHDNQMIVECEQFVYKKDGSLGAEEGEHNYDDVIMASGIGLLVSNRIPMPKLLEDSFSSMVDV